MTEHPKPEPLDAASGINDKLQHFGAGFVTMAWFGHFRQRFATRYLHAAFLSAPPGSLQPGANHLLET